MSIRFLIGRAGSGKTEACLNELRERLLREPDGPPLILLVPEQATFQAEHALVSTPGIGGLLRVQVLSFKRLAWRIMQETGDTSGVPIDDLGKKMLLQRLLHKHHSRLKLYRSTFEQMGFVERLHALFSEWTRYKVTSAALQSQLERLLCSTDEAAGLLSEKLGDLVPVFREYEEETARRFLDGERFLDMLAERIPGSPVLREAEIWIDGFFGFTPQELEVVAVLMQHCRSVTLSLSLNRPYGAGDRPHELDLFHPTATTMCKLQDVIRDRHLLEAEVVILKEDVPPRFINNPMLAHLERYFEYRLSGYAKPYEPKPDELPQLRIRPAVHRRAEVESAAREILALVRDQGLRYRDIAVRVRNVEDYGELFTTVFADYGIPYFMDQKRSVLHHPLIEFIRSSLEAVIRGWSYDAVFRCVKTDFMLPLEENGGHHPIDRHAMDQFENYVLSYGIHGNRWLDARSWELRRSLSLEDEDGTALPLHEDNTLLIQACARTVVEPLRRLQERLKKADTVRNMAEAVYLLLEELHVPRRLERWSEACIAAGTPEKAREHSQIWDMVIEVLDQMAELMGEEAAAPELFAKLMDTGLESLRLGLVPPSLDQVLIGSIDRTRSAQVRTAFVLGVSDGVLPKKLSDDGIIAENEREFLLDQGMPMADSARRKLLDEQFLIYTVLCAPSDRLYLSYPLADEEGKMLLPSEIVKQLQPLFPGLKGRLAEAEPSVELPEEEQAAFITQPGRTLTYMTVQIKQALRGTEIAPVWWSVYDWFASRVEWSERLRTALRALFYTNQADALGTTTSRLLYGEQLRTSVSRMEAFVACPFSHFASHGLKLQERRIYRLEAPDIGQLYHAALSGLAKELAADQANWGTVGEPELLERVSRIVDKLTPRLQSEILTSTARYRHIARKLKGILGRTSVMLAEHARRGEFTPVGLEVGFGPGADLPSLPFLLGNGARMDIIGRIDRVDRAYGDQGMLLRVIDYKSSPTALRLPELYYGLSLQMLTYLDVVLTHSERWLGEPARPAGVLYFHVHNPILQSKNGLAADAAEAAMRKQFKMKGLVSADAETVYLMDGAMRGASGHSELIPVAMKADGSFYKNTSVATEPQWDILRSHVRKVIRSIGTDITDGKVAVEPYRMGKKSACTFCSYKPVCHYDPLFDGNDPRLIRPCGKDEVWLALSEEAHVGGSLARAAGIQAESAGILTGSARITTEHAGNMREQAGAGTERASIKREGRMRQ